MIPPTKEKRCVSDVVTNTIQLFSITKNRTFTSSEYDAWYLSLLITMEFFLKQISPTKLKRFVSDDFFYKAKKFPS